MPTACSAGAAGTSMPKSALRTSCEYPCGRRKQPPHPIASLPRGRPGAASRGGARPRVEPPFDGRLIGEKTGNVGRGINIAIVDYLTGKVRATQYFNMVEGDNSGLMATFIQSAPPKSLLFMVTQDDGASGLKEDAKKVIEALGSKQIRNIKFRSSWVFLTAKGFELPADIQRENINHSDNARNRYSGWPAEIQIEGCIPKMPS